MTEATRSWTTTCLAACSVRTFDDVACVVGAAVGSFALVWLVYERLFALAGKLGFVVVWYATFLILDVVLTATLAPAARR